MLRPAEPRDHAAILALNAESVHFLSPMDAARLRHLDAQAAWHQVVEHEGEVVAFLLGRGEGADYDSPNYRWFATHYRHFLYIDRVVVAAASQGRKFGAQLYDALFAFARASEVERVTCEFDIEPPNEASRRFHARHGFVEVGVQALDGGRKQVSLQACQISARAGE